MNDLLKSYTKFSIDYTLGEITDPLIRGTFRENFGEHFKEFSTIIENFIKYLRILTKYRYDENERLDVDETLDENEYPSEDEDDYFI